MEQGTIGTNNDKIMVSRDIKACRTVVAGATGMVGAHVVARLVLSGCKDITVLVRSEQSLEKLKNILRYHGLDYAQCPIQSVKVSLYDAAALTGALKGADVVFHCAAALFGKRGQTQLMIERNVNITHVIADSCCKAGVGRLIYVSSVAALGTTDGTEAVTEHTAFQTVAGRTSYSISKFFSENEVWRAYARGLDVVVVNPAIIIGYGDWRSKNTPHLFRLVHRGMPFYTTGENGYVGAADVARALVLLASCSGKVSGQRFILCGDHLSFKALFERIAESVQAPAPRIELKKSFLEFFANILESLKKIGLKVKLDRQLITSACKNMHYDGSKITEWTGFEYRPIETHIAEIGHQFLKDFTSKTA